MLEDDAINPILLKMSQPSMRYIDFFFNLEDSPFIEGLKNFQKRVIYANVLNDIQVPYSTAAITPKNPYLKDLSNKKF